MLHGQQNIKYENSFDFDSIGSVPCSREKCIKDVLKILHLVLCVLAVMLLANIRHFTIYAFLFSV
jgi:hypothetical protein